MKKAILFFGDVIILYCALVVTLLARYRVNFAEQLNLHLLPFTLIFVIWLVVFYITNLYDIGFAKNNLQFLSTFSYSIAANFIIFLGFFYLIPYFLITPKTNLLIFVALAAILSAGWRYQFNKLTARSAFGSNTLIIGSDQQSRELSNFLNSNPQLGYWESNVIDVTNLGTALELKRIIQKKKTTTVILNPAVYKTPELIDVFYGLVGFGVDFYNLPDFYERITGRVPVETIDQVWFLENLSERSKDIYEKAKRAVDIIGAFLIGLVSSPLMLSIAIAIRINSRGPIIFRQARMGRAGKTFKLVKFRTMTANAPDGSAEGASGPVWASENDERTTGVGKFIRKTRLDELPQIWNILKGEMSFVGPRPERPEFHEKLAREIPFYKERYIVKPGLTGWAQIKHKLDFRGGMTIQDTLKKLEHDLYYIKNRSLLLDTGIVLKTINILLKKTLR